MIECDLAGPITSLNKSWPKNITKPKIKDCSGTDFFNFY